MHKKPSAANVPPLCLHLEDNEWPLEYIDHDREIVRAIVFDDDGYFYFVRVDRDDEFGKALLIETSGGGVESDEDLSEAILRELREELGITEAEIVAVSENGRMIDFTVRAWDEKGPIGEGTHTRAIIDCQRCLSKCSARLDT